jgi:hypothetical protein|tara:strand:+ start:924 stop:1103 length:180 start_codon:yes stop_codon:yes gene_type:complete
MKYEVLSVFNTWGYDRAQEYIRQLNIQGKISVMERSKLMDMIAVKAIIPKRYKKSEKKA